MNEKGNTAKFKISKMEMVLPLLLSFSYSFINIGSLGQKYFP